MARKPVVQAPPPSAHLPAIRGEVVSLEVPTRDDARPSEMLREVARAIYVTHPDGVTLEELAEDPRFAGISSATLQRWSAQGKWSDERKAIIEAQSARLREDLKKQLWSRITEVRVNQIRDVEVFRSKLNAALAVAVPRSVEGVIKAGIELMKWELELKQGIAQEIVPPTGAGGGGAQIDPRDDLTREEVLDAARIVLEARRAGARKGSTGGPKSKT